MKSKAVSKEDLTNSNLDDEIGFVYVPAKFNNFKGEGKLSEPNWQNKATVKKFDKNQPFRRKD